MKDKVIFVTGGTSGIGRATALAFAAKGARVAITGRRSDQGETVVAEITKQGGKAIFIQGDVSRELDVRQMVEQTVDELGGLDFAFNNAGVEGTFAQVQDQTQENYDFVMDINVRGVWLCLKYEIPAMRARGGGVIINNSSVAGLCGFENCGIYAASKHAVVGLTKAAALENATRGIRINAICPGGVETEMSARLTGGDPKQQAAFKAAHPMNRLGTAEELAQTVVWLCSEGATFMTGQAIGVDGGVNASFGGKVAFES